MAHDVYSLIELQDTASLYDALGHSTRLKYCCLDYSLHHVAVGATSGGVYCFRYEDLSYLRVIANKEGGVSLLRFSPDGSVLAVVCGGGHVIFWQLNLEAEQVSKRIHSCSLLKGCIIKDAVWDDKGFRFFYGDEHGRVAVANIPRLSRVLGNKNIFKIPDGVIYEAKCPLVQLDYRQDSLLVSSTKKCVIIRPGVVGVIQVGTKPRDGNYGACFYSNPETSDVVVYSARPGCRVWEALLSGKVVKTHKFKDPIQEAPPTSLLGIRKNPEFPLVRDHMIGNNIQLLKVHGIRLLVSWQESSLVVVDGIKGHLVLWTDQLNNIVDVAVSNPDSILVLYDGSNKIAKLSVKPLHLCVQELVGMKEWLQSCKVAAHYISHLRNLCRDVHNYYLVGVLQQIIDNCVDGADHDLELLRACVTELTPEVLPQQQQSQEDEEEEEEEKWPEAQENHKQNDWEGLLLNKNQQSLDNTQLLDHVNNDYVITQDDNEPAVLLPTDTVDHMGPDISVVTKSSGAILIESPLLPEVSYEFENVPLSSHDTLDGSHDQTVGSHDQASGSYNGSHDHQEGSHDESMNATHEPLEVVDNSNDKSHELMQRSHDPVDESNDPLNGSHPPSHELIDRSCDQLTSQEQVTELESLDLFSGSHDLTEPLYDDDDAISTYRHRSLTAASASNTPFISLASNGGRQDNTFEVISLSTGSKKKRSKKFGKKKKKQQSSTSLVTVSVAPPLDEPAVQDEQLPTAPVKMTEDDISPVQSRKTSTSTSPASSVYGGTSNPSLPPSESVDGPFKKRSKPAVILRKVKKSLASTITDNVTMREGSSTGRPVAMVKGLISSLTGGMSQGNVTMPTSDVAMESPATSSNDVMIDDTASGGHDNITAVLSAVANQLSQETLAAKSSLGSLDTISDPIQLERTLAKWLGYLEKFWDEEGSHDAVPVSFSLFSGAVQDDIKELLAACLHTEVLFGSHSNNSDIANGALQLEHSEDKSFPDFPNKGLPLDEGLGHFIKRYFLLLDINQLRVKLSACNIDTANSCWDHMISFGNHDDVVKHLSKNLKEDNISPWLPLYVSRIVSHDPSGAVEVCVDHYPYLDMWEVARLYHVTPTHYPFTKNDSSQSDDSKYACYCKYIQKLYQKGTVEWACFHDNVYLVLLWMECLLRIEVSIATELSAANQIQPLKPHPSLPILDKLIDLSCNHISRDNKDHVIQLCYFYSYWLGYIQLCLSVGRLKDAFTTIIKLGNSALLNQPLRWGQLPGNLLEWQMFLECMVEVGPPPTSDSDQSDPPITWEGILLQLIGQHGPLQVTHLLDTIDMSSVELGSFQSRLNRLLVSLTTLQLQQQQLAYNMLGKVDTYLWNPRRNPLGPHAMLLVSNCKPSDINGDQVTQQGEGSQHDIITLEDSECHWGIRVARSDTNCAICSLPLTSNLPSSLGLISFVCGHSYHQQCLPEQACVQCHTATAVNSVK